MAPVSVGNSLSGASPPLELRWKPRLAPWTALRGLWRDRGLVRTLAERDLRARYKQAVFGWAWSFITPILTVLVFNVFFKRIGKIDTGPAPYLLFSYLGLLPWSFFTSAVSSASGSLVFNNSILRKTHCAREVFPLAAIATSLFDSIVALVPLAVLFAAYTRAPRPTSWWVVPILAAQMLLILGLSLGLSILVVYVRDAKQVLGGLLQLGLFFSPVAFPTSSIPERWQPLAAAANPFVGFIDSYRRAVLDGQAPQARLLLPAVATSVVVAAAGYLTFRRFEASVADVA